MSDATTETEDAVQEAVDQRRQPLLDALQTELGDALLGSELSAGDLWVRVDRSAWRRALAFCRDQLGLEYFCFLSGIDWKPAPELSGEKAFEPAEGVGPVENDADEEAGGADEEVTMPGGPDQQLTGAAGGDGRFQVFARVYSVDEHVGITLKTDLDDARPECDSIVGIYAGADWHERETWEMFGFDFVGHPGLRHLYLPGEFEGFPLRKDFPLLAREVKPWPGIVDVEPLPGEPDGGDPAEEGS